MATQGTQPFGEGLGGPARVTGVELCKEASRPQWRHFSRRRVPGPVSES
jgi:hypothetical protein